jgi:putative tricarboxylic transport membrane protein
MKRPYQIASAILLLVAGFVGLEASTMRFYTSLGPGGGFFPLCLSILLAVLAVSVFVQASGEKARVPAGFLPDRAACLKMLAVLAAVGAVTLLLEPLGFCLTMLGFYAFLLTVLGRQSWMTTATVSLAGSFGVYFVFTHWLSTPLPIGLLGI